MNMYNDYEITTPIYYPGIEGERYLIQDNYHSLNIISFFEYYNRPGYYDLRDSYTVALFRIKLKPKPCLTFPQSHISQ